MDDKKHELVLHLDRQRLGSRQNTDDCGSKLQMMMLSPLRREPCVVRKPGFTSSGPNLVSISGVIMVWPGIMVRIVAIYPNVGW